MPESCFVPVVYQLDVRAVYFVASALLSFDSKIMKKSVKNEASPPGRPYAWVKRQF